MMVFRWKRSLFTSWLSAGIGLLLLNACTSESTALTISPPSSSPTVTQTASPTLTPTATQLPEPSFTNPVYKNDFPDPHIILAGDTYYAYSTTNGTTNIHVISSPDLLHWENQGDALPALPKWSVLSAGYTWAPGVIQIDDKFVLYYVARDKEIDRQCIGVAVSEDP